MNEDFLWIPDGSLDAGASAVEPDDPEAQIFGDGYLVAQEPIWDHFAASYLETPTARFAGYAQYAEPAAYSIAVR